MAASELSLTKYENTTTNQTPRSRIRRLEQMPLNKIRQLVHLPQLLRMLVQREEQAEERYQREDERRQKEVAERECMEVVCICSLR